MAEGDVIRRKLAKARGPGAAGAMPAAQGAERAWPLALARAARDAFALGLDVTALESRRRSLAELMDQVPDRAFIALLEGPGEGIGALILSAEVLSGLIEVQTLGRVTPAAVQPRKATRTDAAMVAGWIDQALEALELSLVFDADLPWADGFRYASFLDDPRPMGLLLEDAPFRVLKAQVDLARGTKAGQLLLVLPADGKGRRPRGGDIPPPPAEPAFEALMAERAQTAECVLQALIARVRLPLGAVLKLEEGAVLPLGEASVDSVMIEGTDGRPLATGRLGQTGGARAVRLTGVREAQQGRAADIAPQVTDDQNTGMDEPLLRAG